MLDIFQLTTLLQARRKLISNVSKYYCHILFTMSSIVTSILSSTVGLLWNKTRDKTAESLKDGDITDAKLREIVVRELNDIKTKLDGLSRSYLLSSYSFLQEGIQLLNVCLEKFEQKAVVNEGNDDRGETSRMPSGGESDILNEALQLSQAMGKLQIVSKEFESAKERFKDARKRATDAFCNEGLNIQDRIFAAKLRVVSEILECLDNPDTAASSCLLFLEKLHGLPAVREIFSVYFDGGVKSFFKKTERAENVKSVVMINYVLYRFVSKFSSKCCSALAWPTIQLPDRSFNPICNWEEVSTRKSWGEDFIEPPNRLKLNELMYPSNSAVNSRGEIVSINRESGDMTVISRIGTTKLSFPTEDKEARVIVRQVLGVGINEENDVYLVVFEKTSENVYGYAALYILDEHYTRVKHKSTLHFLSKLSEFRFKFVKMAVKKNNNIVITPAVSDDYYVYICDNAGQLKHRFLWERIKPELGRKMTSISDKNEVILALFLSDNVDLYTEEGKLKVTLKLPAGHVVYGVAFHFIVRKIIVFSRLSLYFWSPTEYLFFLHCYSETGKLENSTFLFKKESCISDFAFAITSHPSGPVAFVGEKSITYI